jgi:hypothetical protein
MPGPAKHTVTVQSFTDSQGREVPCERYEVVIGIDLDWGGPEFTCIVGAVMLDEQKRVQATTGN